MTRSASHVIEKQQDDDLALCDSESGGGRMIALVASDTAGQELLPDMMTIVVPKG